MEYNYLGRSGLRVSELCLGTMTFGGRQIFGKFGNTQLSEAKELISIALDAGVNILDTADLYSEGLSEEIIGKALGLKRKDVLILTKVRFQTYGTGPNNTGLTRHHIISSIERSLKNLNTDYIDIYMMHGPDFKTPLEESLRAFDDLIRQGKVRYIACSNFPSWFLMKALYTSERCNLERFIAYQGLYNLASREMENDIIPACIEEGLGIMAWSPLAGGYFTGKYRRGKEIPKSARWGDSSAPFINNMFPAQDENGFQIVDELERIAENHKATIAQSAINYLLRKPGVATIVLGARTKDQLLDNLKSVNWKMTEDEVAKLDELSNPVSQYPYWYLKMNCSDR